MQTSLLRSALLVALAAGCAGTGQLTVTGEATVPAPELVVISPGVQVIADLDEPIFYSDNYYWRNQGGAWYRSTSHTRGWARVEVAPVAIRTIERPSAYVHYRGAVRTRASTDRREVAAPPPRHDDRRGKDDRHDNDDRRDNDHRHDKDDRRHDKDDHRDRDHRDDDHRDGGH